MGEVPHYWYEREFPDWAIAFVVLSSLLPFLSSLVHFCCAKSKSSQEIRFDVSVISFKPADDPSSPSSFCRTCSLHWYIGKDINSIGGVILKHIFDFSKEFLVLP